MSRPGFLKAHLALVLLCLPAVAQNSAKQDASKQDFPKEGAVIEQMVTRVVFQSDGTSTREQRARVRVQSEAGAQQYGVLRFPYQASVERVEVPDVRVIKTNGAVVTTPPDSIQDVTSEIYREAPLYSDLREKHVAVKGLEPGDTLEYSVRWQLEKPLAPRQFWFGYQFIKSAIILGERLEISVPHEREVKLKSQTVQPTTSEENGRRIYIWKTSNLESESAEKQEEVQKYDAIRGLLPPSDVLISSFRTWEEVGRWYYGLQQEKIQPSPAVKAKAEELTKGLSDEDAKLRAIYNYVSLHYRYVAISFGIGRYQPHAAATILGNQYGDCKDKHTLLAALLSAVGIRAYPALINTQTAVDADVPSPGQFVEADPKQVLPQKILGFMYMSVGNRDNAIATWQKVQSIAPEDPDVPPNLGGLYLALKRYPEAASLFESAAKANPSDAYAQMRLGIVRLRSHNTDQGVDALHKALEIDSGAEMLNDVAYEMAEAGTNLPEALGYSQRSVKEVEERSQKVDLENLQKADLQLPLRISACWDTLGWIYFKMGDLARAESYLNSAWQLALDGVVGDHLGQVYEKEQKLPAALHLYSLALEANPRLEETPSRMRNLANVSLPKNRMSAGEELRQMRTVKLPTIMKETASADFDILVAPSGKIEKANFFRGSDLLRYAGESLEKAPFIQSFPPGSTANLLRRGTLSCSSYTGCTFVFYPPSVAAGRQPAPASTQPGTPALAPKSSTVLITARLKDGTPTGLSTADIEIKVDGKPVTVQEVVAGAPMHYCLLFDGSATERGRFKLQQHEAIELLSKVPESDHGMLVDFGDEYYLDADWTNPLVLANKIASEQPDQRGTALYDAVVASADHMSKSSPDPGPRVMFIFSHSEDNESALSQDRAVQLVLKAGIRIYVIGQPPQKNPDVLWTVKASKTLRQLAERTGGKAYFPEQKDAGKAVADIADDLTNLFAVTLDLPGQEKDGRLHKLELKCSKKDVSIRGPDRYYAPQP